MTMRETLERLTRITGVKAAALTDYEGILIEEQAAIGLVSAEDLSARSAEVGRLVRRTADVWGGGQMQVAFLESSMGTLVLADVGRGYLLVVADPTVNAGMLRLGVEQAAEQLRRLLGQSFLLSEGAGCAATG